MPPAPTLDRVLRAVKFGEDKGVGEVERWCDAGGDPNAVDAKGQKRSSLLHWAAYSGNPYIVHALLRYGADADARETDGKTPLHLAAYEGHPEVVKLLLRTGADYRISDKPGKVPCHLAILNKKWEVARLFPNFRELADPADAAGWRFDQSMWNTQLGSLDLPENLRSPVRREETTATVPIAPPVTQRAVPIADVIPEVSRMEAASPPEAIGQAVQASPPPPVAHGPPTRVLRVVGGERAYPVDGLYTLAPRPFNGYPLWACGDCRIYSGTKAVWILTESAVYMHEDRGLIMSSTAHNGMMPGDPALTWDTFDEYALNDDSLDGQAGAWVADPAVTITPEGSSGGVDRQASTSGGGSTGAVLPEAVVARMQRIEDKEEEQRAKEERQETKRRADIRKYIDRDLDERGLRTELHRQRSAGSLRPQAASANGPQAASAGSLRPQATGQQQQGETAEERAQRKAEKKARKAAKEAARAEQQAGRGAEQNGAPSEQDVIRRVGRVLYQEFGSISEGVANMRMPLLDGGQTVNGDELSLGLRRVRLREEAAEVDAVFGGRDADIRSWGIVPPPDTGLRPWSTFGDEPSGLPPSSGRKQETEDERQLRREERRRIRREERERARMDRRQKREKAREERRRFKEAERRRLEGESRSLLGRRSDARSDASPRPRVPPSEPSPRRPIVSAEFSAPSRRSGRTRSRTSRRSARSKSNTSYRSFGSPNTSRSMSRSYGSPRDRSMSRDSVNDYRRPWKPPGPPPLLGFGGYNLRLAGWPPPQQRSPRPSGRMRGRSASRSQGQFSPAPAGWSQY
eukprot:Hpha_TRINITY_DN15872_c1_g4::TRINITY_DN15872_c1_g4_i1::g.187891::m.187891